MRHHNTNRKLGRERNQRKALLKSLALSLITHGKIKTTEVRAKELRPFVEKLITKGKNDTLARRRSIIARLGNKAGGSRIVREIAPKYKTRSGGYTRITKLPQRKSDGSRMAVIEFV